MNNDILLANIKELCKKSNTPISNLEKKMGIGAGTISRWNKANPSLDKIISIARYFNVSIDFLTGYTPENAPHISIDNETSKIIEYLAGMTAETGENESFWHDYAKNHSLELLISDLPSTACDMGKLLYAYDETGYYLLDVVYLLNDYYDYETQIRLYLVPDEFTIPVLECSDKSELQPLYVAAVKNLEMLEVQKNAKEKADLQRKKILKKMEQLNGM